ncbi:hypothetical protein CF319_g9137 [Tilletia indica]|uniref:Uncharacterized protein n=1 Tax=Tilletia indica TaxID=43049 RepID=A0A177SZ31_9BASI|nr:hypothetical protein CF319_g9137 [Tilletia indica]KAE8237063.1 hypothetical protein A4X13_0g8927 [Tilletia indica]
MFHHLQLSPLALDVEPARISFAADDHGYAYIHRSTSIPAGAHPFLLSRRVRISFSRGAFNLHAVGGDSHVLLNGTRMTSFGSETLHSADIIELGRTDASPFEADLTCQVDIMVSNLSRASFPDPVTHSVSTSAPFYTHMAELRRAVNDHQDDLRFAPRRGLGSAAFMFGRPRSTNEVHLVSQTNLCATPTHPPVPSSLITSSSPLSSSSSVFGLYLFGCNHLYVRFPTWVDIIRFTSCFPTSAFITFPMLAPGVSLRNRGYAADA